MSFPLIPMRNVRRTLALCTFLIVAAPAAANAQRTASDIESARQLYNQGIELRDKGDTKSALEKFRAAHALEFAALDEHCERLTASETLIGRYETIGVLK